MAASVLPAAEEVAAALAAAGAEAARQAPACAELAEVRCLSDVHVDHPANMRWLERLPPRPRCLLALAGDATDDVDRLRACFRTVRGKYGAVCFVPGNHELWVRGRGADGVDSVGKFAAVLRACTEEGVLTAPVLVGAGGGAPCLIVPLFSWYVRRDAGAGAGGLYAAKEGEDPQMTADCWTDNHCCRWPAALTEPAGDPSEWLLSLNEARVAAAAAQPHPVVSFSHFLPRRELMYEDAAENRRRAAAAAAAGATLREAGDQAVWFNFSRVAGAAGIEEQVRRMRSAVHIHGHQHRQRDREVGGVRYVSHCLGYAEERQRWACVAGDDAKRVWPPEAPAAPPASSSSM